MKPFAALTAQEKFIEIVRWLSVPIAAAAAVAILILLARIAMPPQYVQPPGAPPPPAPAIPRVVTFRLFSVVMGLAFVVAGAKTAPRQRMVVACFLAALWVGRAFMYRIFVHLGGTPHYLDFALAIAATAAAIALIYYTEKPSHYTEKPSHAIPDR